MNADWWALIAQILVLIGAIVAAVISQRSSRKQPVRDEAEAGHVNVDADRLRQTIENMNEQSNARRDIRIAQLHGFLLLDQEYHLVVIANERKLISIVKELILMVQELGGDCSHIIVPLPSPLPPPIPDPPPIPV